MHDLEQAYGAGEVRMRRLSDAAGVLKLKERRGAEKLFGQFEKYFPQLFFSVHFGALDDRVNIRQFGMWLLNKAAYEDVDIGKPNDAGIILLIDVNSKSATISFGYFLDPYLSEVDTFSILSKAHPYLLQGNYYKALCVSVKGLIKILRKRSRHVKRYPEKYQKLLGLSADAMVSELEPIRKDHSHGAASRQQVHNDKEMLR